MSSNVVPHSFEIKNNKIEFDNLVFYIIDSNSTIKIEHLIGYDAIIIDAKDAEFTKLILKKIRGHYNPEFYLKPVFFINYKEVKDPILENMNDGIIHSYDQLKEIADTTKQIFLRTTQLDYQPVATFEGQMIKKVLNFMFTREVKSLTPIPDLKSSIGYTYPEISINFDSTEETQVLEILSWGEKEGLIWPDFYERIYLCNQCGGGFLSYREVCPHCNSSNSSAQDLVHHFPCAYIGPISDFRNSIDNSLTCPKCNKALRHIGVDYDKPSIIHHCNNCDKNFQDFFVKAKCISCTQDIEVQYLIPKSINIYKLTKRGRTAAASGFLSSGKEVDDIFGTIALPVFKTMLHYEIERIKENSEQKSAIAIVNIENILELYKKIGKKSEKAILENIVNLIRENIKPTDFMALENSSTLYLGLINTDFVQSERNFMNLKTLVEKLVKNNYNDFEIKFNFKVRELQPFSKSELQLQELTKDLFD